MNNPLQDLSLLVRRFGFSGVIAVFLLLLGCGGGSGGDEGGGANSPPTVRSETASARSGISVDVDVLSNDLDPDGGSLTLVGVTPPRSGSASIVSANVLRYVPAPGFTGTEQVVYRVSDGQGGESSGTLVVTVADLPASHPPSLTIPWRKHLLREDAPPILLDGAALVSDPDTGTFPGGRITLSYLLGGDAGDRIEVRHQGDGPGQIGVEGNQIRFGGVLVATTEGGVGGVDPFMVSTLETAGLEAVEALIRNLTFRSVSVASGGTTRRLRFSFTDGTGATSEPRFCDLEVLSVNDAPTFVLRPVILPEGSGSVTRTDWVTSVGPGDEAEIGQTLTWQLGAVSNPSLFAIPPTLTPGGSLTLTPLPEASGTTLLDVVLRDDGGTANGGADTSPTEQLLVEIVAVNDPPAFTRGADQVVREEAGPQTVPAWATGISVGPASEADQTLGFRVVGNTDPTLFQAGPEVSPDGTLTYTPAPDAHGNATIRLVAQDSGGTANGGSDTSPEQTFQIQVTPVNDAPSFSRGPDLLVLEDSGPRSFPGWAGNLSPGPVDESGQSLSFLVQGNSSPGLFASGPAVGSDGTLTFEPAPDAHGVATIDLALRDDGGTVDGGVDTSPVQSFEIRVAPVNDRPEFTPGSDQVALEDAGPQTVPDWATGLSRGPPDEAGQTLAFVVTGNTDPTLFVGGPSVAPDGTLSYLPAPDAVGSATITLVLVDNGGNAGGGENNSLPRSFTIDLAPVNDPPSFVVGPDLAVPEDAGAQTFPGWATGLAAGPEDESGQSLTFRVTGNSNPALFAVGPSVSAGGDLSFTPAADAHGSATLSLVLEDDGGTAAGGVDSSPAQSFVVQVTPVNDPPDFVAGPDQVVLEDSGPQTMASWATALLAGPPDEAGQNLAFTVTGNSAPDLFDAVPSIAPDGTLSYTPAPDAVGTASISLVLVDDGGTSDGGLDTSATHTFAITLEGVNDPPSFTPGADSVVLEDSGPQAISDWAGSFSPGPTDEAAQGLSFLIVGNTNPGLFASGPQVDPDGTLRFQPAPDTNGMATLDLVLVDDGGTANGGVDVGSPESFQIQVRPVNDPPSFLPGPDQVVLENSGQHILPGWATSIVPGPPDEGGQVTSFEVVSNSNPSLFTGAPTVSSGGDLSFLLAAGVKGEAAIQVRVRDDGGTGDGGLDAGPPREFRITSREFRRARGFLNGFSAMAVAEDGSGDVYLAGGGDAYGDVPLIGGIFRLNVDGTIDSQFDPGSGFTDTVSALEVAGDGSGDIYVGGYLRKFNGLSIDSLVRLNADGSIDLGFDPGAIPAGGGAAGVSVIVPVKDGTGDIYVGGAFEALRGTTTGHLLRLNSDGTVDPGFATGAGFDLYVFCAAMARDGSGDVYVGGSFTTYDGTPVGKVVRLNSDGSLDAAFSTDSSIDGYVEELAVAEDGSGDLYIGGRIETFDGVPAGVVLRLNSDGSRDLSFDAGRADSSSPYAIEVVPDGSGDLLVGGRFSTIDSQATGAMIRLNPDGSLDSSVDFGTGIGDGTVRAIALDYDGAGNTLVAGSFYDFDGVGVRHIARLRADGSLDPILGTGAGFSRSVYSLVPDPTGSGKVYAAGWFRRYDGKPASRVARLSPAGELDLSIPDSDGPNFTVNAIGLASDGSGDIYIGGGFTRVGTNWVSRIARLNQDGSFDAAFAVASGLFYIVQSIAIVPDGSGDIFVGGEYIATGGSTRGRVVRLTPAGAVVASFDTGGGFDHRVLVVLPVDDGSGGLYVGGYFTSFDGTPVGRLARLNADGSLDGSFSTGAGFDDAVFSLALSRDGSGDLYVGGSFDSYDGSASNQVLRLNSDGSLDPGFMVGTGFDGSFIEALAPAVDGSGNLYVGGSLSYDGTAIRGLVRLGPDGRLDPLFATGEGPSTTVRALAVAIDGTGDVFVGTDYGAFDGLPIDSIARVAPNGSLR